MPRTQPDRGAEGGVVEEEEEVVAMVGEGTVEEGEMVEAGSAILGSYDCFAA